MPEDIDKIIKDIKSIKIQGATNIAKASIGAIFDYSKNFSVKNPDDFFRDIEAGIHKLAWARPNEPLTQNLLNFLAAKLKKDKKNGNIKDTIINFQKFCRQALDLISKNEQSIAANGIKLIRKIYKKKNQPAVIFTHCNSSSAVKILIGAHKAGIPLKVYNSETRPRYQGRIMAKNLIKAGIDITTMADSAAPFVISKNDPDEIDVDLVIIGADVVGLDGSALNKIGSYSLVLAAKNARVPFYVAASLLKVRKGINSCRKIEIEKRDPSELWLKPLKGIKVVNYAFDAVPPKYITGFITEFGILKPKMVKKMAMKNYKEIFK